MVESAVAISLLSEQHPGAAEWWRQNTPQYLVAGRRFIFAAEACEEEIPEVVWPPAPALTTDATLPKSASGPAVSVYGSHSPVQAHIVKGMLENSGIECFLSNELLASLSMPISFATGGIQILVRASDARNRAGGSLLRGRGLAGRPASSRERKPQHISS